MTWRIIQNFFQNTKWKGMWSSLELPHCFTGRVTPPQATQKRHPFTEDPDGSLLPSSLSSNLQFEEITCCIWCLLTFHLCSPLCLLCCCPHVLRELSAALLPLSTVASSYVTSGQSCPPHTSPLSLGFVFILLWVLFKFWRIIQYEL